MLNNISQNLSVVLEKPPCDEYDDACECYKSTFNIDCFGDCDRTNPMDQSPLDLKLAWNGCHGEVILTRRYLYCHNANETCFK